MHLTDLVREVCKVEMDESHEGRVKFLINPDFIEDYSSPDKDAAIAFFELSGKDMKYSLVKGAYSLAEGLSVELSGKSVVERLKEIEKVLGKQSIAYRRAYNAEEFAGIYAKAMQHHLRNLSLGSRGFSNYIYNRVLTQNARNIVQYVKDREEVTLSIKKDNHHIDVPLNSSQFKVLLSSSVSDIAKAPFTQAQAQEFHKYINHKLKNQLGVAADDILDTKVTYQEVVAALTEGTITNGLKVRLLQGVQLAVTEGNTELVRQLTKAIHTARTASSDIFKGL